MILNEFYMIPLMFQIILGIAFGTILRIYVMDGFLTLPEWRDNKLKLNSLGTVFVSIMGFLLFYQINPDVVTNFLTALLIAYTSPHLFEKIPLRRDPEGPQSQEDIA